VEGARDANLEKARARKLPSEPRRRPRTEWSSCQCGTRCASREDTSAPIGRITSFSAKFTDAPLAEGKFETYLHERENAKTSAKTPKSRAP
jgi:hypothetical protein